MNLIDITEYLVAPKKRSEPEAEMDRRIKAFELWMVSVERDSFSMCVNENLPKSEAHLWHQLYWISTCGFAHQLASHTIELAKRDSVALLLSKTTGDRCVAAISAERVTLAAFGNYYRERSTNAGIFRTEAVELSWPVLFAA
jgi:hypothetical protein